MDVLSEVLSVIQLEGHSFSTPSFPLPGALLIRDNKELRRIFHLHQDTSSAITS